MKYDFNEWRNEWRKDPNFFHQQEPKDGERVSGTPDFVEMSRRIRMFALHCKNKDAFSCEFGNEFAPKVEEYLRECWRG